MAVASDGHGASYLVSAAGGNPESSYPKKTSTQATPAWFSGRTKVVFDLGMDNQQIREGSCTSTSPAATCIQFRGQRFLRHVGLLTGGTSPHSPTPSSPTLRIFDLGIPSNGRRCLLAVRSELPVFRTIAGISISYDGDTIRECLGFS